MMLVLADASQFMNDWAWNLEGLGRLGLAALLGAIVGAEREHRGRSAGFRTQLLVTLGAALAMLVSLHFERVFGAMGGALRVDPARVAYGVMAGVGFLGAGAIIRHEIGVRGLTTAASLWCNAAIGLACGFGMYTLAVATTAIMIFALVILHKFEEWMPSRIYKSVCVLLPTGDGKNSARLTETFTQRGINVRETDLRRDLPRGTDRITVRVSFSTRKDPGDLMSILQELPGVQEIEIH